MDSKKGFYITTTIPYANAPPHIGFALEIIQADVLARLERLKGRDVFFLTGTDEHGTKNYQTAKKQGLTPQAFVDKNASFFKKLTKVLNISNSYFIRTTDRKVHWPGVIEIWKALAKKGDIYKKTYEGYYCSGCERFITEKDLENGRCPNHPNIEIQRISEENYFFRLSKYSDRIRKLVESGRLEIIPEKWKNDFLGLIKDGLTDVSFSRDRKHLPWGIPVPGDEKQILYVWCDALTNYLTGIGFPDKKYRKYWPADIHVVGKDMLRFHAGIWPGMLLGAGIELPERIIVHGFLTVNGQKMSKSLGNVIDPIHLAKEYSPDYLRYFLIRNIPFGDDGDFSVSEMAERVNNELVSNLANFCYRTLSFIEKTGSEIRKPGTSKEDNKIMKNVNEKIRLTKESFDGFRFDRAIKHILEIGDLGNGYFQEQQPWVLAKKDKKRCDEVLAIAANIVRDIIILIKPVTPEFSERIGKQMNLPGLGWDDLSEELKEHKIGKPEIVLRNIEENEKEAGKMESGDPFGKLDLKVAKIESVEDHPNADRLFLINLDVGTEKRQIVASIKKWFTKEELTGKNLVVLTNLKPANFRGIDSNGMLLAVEKDGKLGLLTSDAGPGESVFVEGIGKEPKKDLDIKEFWALEILAKKDGVYYKEKKLRTGKDEVRVENGIEGKVC